MERVGIITYFGENYGACLQAYAVQESVKSLGYQAQIINYLPIYKENIFHKTMRRTKHIFELNRYKKYFVKKYIQKKYVEELSGRSLKFQDFIRTYLNITEKSYENIFELENAKFDYDVYVTGSDQLWNPSHHGCNPVYFLDFVPEGKKRVALAPSIARRNIPDKYKTKMSLLLEKMDYISVREDINVETVQKLVPNKEVYHVLDPTFMLDSKDWDKIISSPLVDGEYVFCYLFGDLDYVEKFINHIKETTGYKIVSMPYNIRELESKNTEKIFNAGPLEFINLIRNAKLIITDSFHATAFSINYNKPFYTLLRQEERDPDNMNSRFFSILNLVGLEERLVLPEKGFPNGDFIKIDYTKANKKLNFARMKTKEYMEGSMSSGDM